MCVHVHIYVCIYVCVCVHAHMYTHKVEVIFECPSSGGSHLGLELTKPTTLSFILHEFQGLTHILILVHQVFIN